MKDFINKNKKLIIYALAGVLLLIFSSVFTSQSVGTDNLEKKFTQIVEKIDGVGNISVMLNKTTDNKIGGVVIVAEGAKNPTVKQTITDAAVAALGVPSYKVQVFSQK